MLCSVVCMSYLGLVAKRQCPEETATLVDTIIYYRLAVARLMMCHGGALDSAL